MTELREDIVEFLRTELVGPRPGLPFVQLNGEEVLPPDDPPRLRYGVGILFPTQLTIDLQEDDEAAPELEEIGDDLSGNGDGSAAVESFTGSPAGSDPVDTQTENDLELNRANEFLPSAMGLTCLVSSESDLIVSVETAQYERIKVKNTAHRVKDGGDPQFWFRRPVSEQFLILKDELEVLEPKVLRYAVPVYNEKSALELHLFIRHSEDPFLNSKSAIFVTATLINRSVGEKYGNDDICFFQTGLAIEINQSSGRFIEYPDRVIDENSTDEQAELELLYRHKKVYAVGHGIAADWELEDEACTRVFTSSLPDYELKPILPASIEDADLNMFKMSQMSDGGVGDLRILARHYSAWIEDLRDSIKHVPENLREAAERNLGKCEECAKRIDRGLTLLEENERALMAFRLMNKVMVMQNEHYQLATAGKRSWVTEGKTQRLEKKYVEPDYSKSDRKWHPFQIAFILMTIRSMCLEDEIDLYERSIVDLIWFPTGGGKTEAYLGLTAFTIFFRRLTDPENAGTTALMRYTLRLLTTQQFQRAASMICACEILRLNENSELGKQPITIGLWVGGSVTPNNEKMALEALNNLARGDRENPFIVLACPWCGAQMGPVKHGRMTKTRGYRKLSKPNRVRMICEDNDCPFSDDEGLPLLVIDEQIYSTPPTLLVGTVDKFALLPWRPHAGRLFGIGKQVSPPDLIIQDELHLISGPLGSMVGHYETLIDAFTQNEHEGKRLPAKIVASTATISRAEEQIKHLYGGRGAMLFPPQGLQAGDSFFAKEREDLAGRKYVGVFATGLPSLTTTEVRVLATLLQAPPYLSDGPLSQVDPYWTLMVYFNSIRELGHAATLLRADIAEYLAVIWKRLGLSKGYGDQQGAKRRYINNDMELTSRIQNSEVTEYMEKLFIELKDGIQTYPIDVCIATNMIQVGLDVPRLSHMAIVGQPKTTAEYIQASSRVGRSSLGPGLVVTLLSPAKPRDRSHAEHFRSFHQSIYKHVEPTSVTPFAIPVTERALHALIITMARYWNDDGDLTMPDLPPVYIQDKIKDEIRQRVRRVDPPEETRTMNLVQAIFDEWERLPPDIWGDWSSPDHQVPFMYPAGEHPDEMWDDRAYETPTSMRNVDATCNAAIISNYLHEDA
ncbi:helicase-related protein [Pseudomonadota bacterium]